MDANEVEAAVQAALMYHGQSYSCAQSVACATCHLAGLDIDEAFRLAEGFGAGMGGYDQVCGALTGGALVMGYARSGGRQQCATKPATHQLVHGFVEEFAREHGGCTLCADLHWETGPEQGARCDGYIADATRGVIARLGADDNAAHRS